MLSVASDGEEEQTDGIALFQLRGSASKPLQTLQSGAVNQDDEFRVGACVALVNGRMCSCCCVDHQRIH